MTGPLECQQISGDKLGRAAFGGGLLWGAYEIGFELSFAH